LFHNVGVLSNIYPLELFITLRTLHISDTTVLSFNRLFYHFALKSFMHANNDSYNKNNEYVI